MMGMSGNPPRDRHTTVLMNSPWSPYGRPASERRFVPHSTSSIFGVVAPTEKRKAPSATSGSARTVERRREEPRGRRCRRAGRAARPECPRPTRRVRPAPRRVPPRSSGASAGSALEHAAPKRGDLHRRVPAAAVDHEAVGVSASTAASRAGSAPASFSAGTTTPSVEAARTRRGGPLPRPAGRSGGRRPPSRQHRGAIPARARRAVFSHHSLRESAFARYSAAGPGTTSPLSYAITTSWARSRAPSFIITRVTCVLAVAGLMKSSLGDLVVRQALRDEREHLALALGELRRARRGARVRTSGARRTRR